MSLFRSKGLKQLSASVYSVNAGLVLSHLQRLVVKAFLTTS